MKFYFPVHLDGGNRGCEAIAKSTALILNQPKENLVGLCTDIPTDNNLGLDQCVTLKHIELPLYQRIINRLSRYLHLNTLRRSIYDYFLRPMRKEDVMISTGGDMMCYGNNFVIDTNDIATRKGCKTVLWGCSMAASNLTPEKEETLRKFDLIYARESLTYDFFKSIGLNNVICYPDPAFLLKPEKVELPALIENGNCIGINISNYTIGAFTLDTPFGQEVKQLLDYIIHKTTKTIVLIPHVLWEKQDDRLIMRAVLDDYKDFFDRFLLLDSDNYNYQQIRYIISKLEIFIGARTHSMISAYSCCVPSIALGYSIKSKGIAKDLGLSDQMIVDTRNYKTGELLASFMYTQEHCNDIRQHLHTIIPSYIEQLDKLKKEVPTLFQ